MKRRRRLLCALALLFAVNVTLISLFQYAEAAVTYRQGDTGQAVRTIQDKLKRWGYYDGSVDGIFGSGTASAVRYFQRSNGELSGSQAARQSGCYCHSGRAACFVACF